MGQNVEGHHCGFTFPDCAGVPLAAIETTIENQALGLGVLHMRTIEKLGAESLPGARSPKGICTYVASSQIAAH
jgi:hypothetical protein